MDHERLDLLGVSPPLVQAFVGPVGPPGYGCFGLDVVGVGLWDDERTSEVSRREMLKN